MYHSITLINSAGVRKNTWADWHLIPSAKPTFPMPEFSQNYVDIPGRNGSIDMSEYLTGHVTYADRSGSFEFYMIDTDIADDWDERCNTIAEFLHGIKVKAILEDDPLYYYEGRFSLSNKNTGSPTPKITISFRVEPFKKFINNASELKF